MDETIPLFEANVQQIAAQLNDEGIRDQWKNTRADYQRIESEKCIDYNHAVISAYSIGTTPIHTFLLRHLVSSHISFSDPMHIVCLCGGSGAELLACVLANGKNANSSPLRFTIIDKEPLWESTYYAHSLSLKHRLQTLAASLHAQGYQFDYSFIPMDLLYESRTCKTFSLLGMSIQ